MIHHQCGNSRANYHRNAFFYTDTTWDFHLHKNLEVIYVLEGCVKCTVNNVLYHLTAGQFGLCLPYDIHRYEPEENTRYWVLVFSEDYVRFFVKQTAGKVAQSFPFHCCPAVENYVKEQLIFNDSPTILTLKSCLYAICQEFLEMIELEKRDLKETLIISQVIDYIEANLSGKISLADLAANLGYDYNYMSRYFRRIFRMTFTEFVNIYRLEAAIRLLEDTDKNITSIAYESGFQSVRSFNTFFKERAGCTPSQYRNTSRK